MVASWMKEKSNPDKYVLIEVERRATRTEEQADGNEIVKTGTEKKREIMNLTK